MGIWQPEENLAILPQRKRATGDASRLLALSEGKRELEDLISDEDAQVELLQVFVTLEPHGTGSFFMRTENRFVEHRRLVWLSQIREKVGRGDDQPSFLRCVIDVDSRRRRDRTGFR